MSPARKKALYRLTRERLFQYYFVGIDSSDRLISGRRGWVFEAGPDRLGVVVVGRDYSERLSYCNYKDFFDALARIEVLRDPIEACFYANNPNARHAP